MFTRFFFSATVTVLVTNFAFAAKRPGSSEQIVDHPPAKIAQLNAVIESMLQVDVASRSYLSSMIIAIEHLGAAAHTISPIDYSVLVRSDLDPSTQVRLSTEAVKQAQADPSKTKFSPATWNELALAQEGFHSALVEFVLKVSADVGNWTPLNNGESLMLRLANLFQQLGRKIGSDLTQTAELAAETSSQIFSRTKDTVPQELLSNWAEATGRLMNEGRNPYLQMSAFYQSEVAEMISRALREIDTGQSPSKTLAQARQHLRAIEEMRNSAPPMGVANQISDFQNTSAKLTCLTLFISR